ncbi:alpha/beta fold hydrolase [Salinibacterium sp. GXW1014]|uniref:alpha/beta fold hydrolase n=1 Tax=Salinibacterium sp. GXW1014 TaxID=3377838 RepID=UPI00383ADC0C
MVKFTAIRNERTFVDAHGVTIHFYEWKVGKPRGIIQISHGLGEHAVRYEDVAQAFVGAGYTVYADDHRGHGQTGLLQWNGDLSKMGKLGPGGLRATIEGVRSLTRLIREENADVPLAIVGHSWGSLLAQIVVNDHPDEYDAVILTGTAYRTFAHMNSGDLNKRHRHLGATGNEWLSRDPAIAQAFADDPLCFTASAIKQFGLWDALKLLGRPRRNLAHDVPLLIQVGGDDPFGGERSAELLAESYIGRSGLTDVELIVYTDARHEVFNETNRDEVFADTLEWLADRLPEHAGE